MSPATGPLLATTRKDDYYALDAVVGYAFSHVFPGDGGADSALPTAIAPTKR